MSEAEERAAVVAEALSWEKTPFMWECALRGRGVDCGRFLAAVFNNAGVKKINIKSLPRLSPQWFLHKASNSYIDIIRQFAVEYTLEAEQVPQPGDIVVAKHGLDWAHGAIVVEWPSIIGAAYGHCVTRWQNIRTSPQYQNRELRFLNPWGKHD